MSELTTEDRLAITELLAVYCHHLDQGRWEELRALFVDDCRLDFGKVLGAYEGAEGVRRFTDTLAKLPIVMRHYNTNVVIRGDGSKAHVESYVLAITGTGDGRSYATGRYDDEFVKRDGRWRIRERRAVIER